jgi:carboxyl-terminal processing protease
MNHLPHTLRAMAAICLALAASAAAASFPGATDEPLASLQAAFARSVTPGEQADRHQMLMGTVFARIHRSYATEADLHAVAAAATKVLEALPPGEGDPAEVFRKSVNAGLRVLDPYSRYLDPRAHAADRAESSGSFVGLGLEVEAGDGGVRVVATMPGSPATRAGLQSGDTIVRVDDEPMQGVPLADAIARMRGEAGTPVSVTVRRADLPEPFTLALVRDTIRRQSLRWNMEGDVLVLRLGGFRGRVTTELEEAVAQASAARAPKAAVLDLRGNPGGLLREAVTVADAFLSQGEIVSVRGRLPSNQRRWQADAAELLAGLPMVVLIDRRSASAAELVADALQDHGRAKVMGQRSFGKGSVQATYSLGPEMGALKLTTSLYHGPSGRTVQRAGVLPDIELLAPQRPARAGADAVTEPSMSDAQAPRVQVEQARCAALYKVPDPGLACAIAYLQAADLEAFVEATRTPQP